MPYGRGRTAPGGDSRLVDPQRTARRTTTSSLFGDSRLVDPQRTYSRRTYTSILPREPISHEPNQPVMPTMMAVRKADQKPPQI